MPSTDRPVVLIVEDEQDLADLYASWLADTNNVHVAYTGTDAIDQLDDSIDVVLLDRRMPDKSGDAVLDVINNRNLPCRVAMVTAVEPDFDIVEMGFDDYLVKPVTKQELRNTTARLYGRQTYTTDIRNFAATASKLAALETQKSPAELEESTEYAELESQFNELRARADASLGELGHDDFEALFRDLTDADPARRDNNSNHQ